MATVSAAGACPPASLHRTLNVPLCSTTSREPAVSVTASRHCRMTGSATEASSSASKRCLSTRPCFKAAMTMASRSILRNPSATKCVSMIATSAEDVWMRGTRSLRQSLQQAMSMDSKANPTRTAGGIERGATASCRRHQSSTARCRRSLSHSVIPRRSNCASRFPASLPTDAAFAARARAARRRARRLSSGSAARS